MTLTDSHRAELDRQIAHQVDLIEQAQDRYTFTVPVGGAQYHVAFSIMGTVKRVNVIGEPALLVDSNEAEYVTEKLWEGLE
jgi:hypothetical protein